MRIPAPVLCLWLVLFAVLLGIGYSFSWLVALFLGVSLFLGIAIGILSLAIAITYND